MNKTKTVQKIAVSSSPDKKLKPSLKERIKKYFLDNCDIISAGIMAMNGGHYYIPPKTRM